MSSQFIKADESGIGTKSSREFYVSRRLRIVASSVSSFVVFENEIGADSRRRRSIASWDPRACRSRASIFLTEEIIEPLGTRRCKTGNKWRRKFFLYSIFFPFAFIRNGWVFWEKLCAAIETSESQVKGSLWKRRRYFAWNHQTF